MSVALVKMNKKIDNLQRDLDALLKADLETAEHQLERALIRLSHNNYPGAFEEFNLILRFSEMAYPKVKGFENKVFCTRLTIFSHLMINTFDIASKSFLPITTLTTGKKKVIADIIFADLQQIVQEFEGIKPGFIKSFWSAPKQDEQNIMDSLIKVHYQLYGLTLTCSNIVISMIPIWSNICQMGLKTELKYTLKANGQLKYGRITIFFVGRL